MAAAIRDPGANRAGGSMAAAICDPGANRAARRDLRRDPRSRREPGGRREPGKRAERVVTAGATSD